MTYCDATFGPMLVRREIIEKLKGLQLDLSNLSIADRLVFFTANPDVRVINCPDCMFYTLSRESLTKNDLMRTARPELI